MFDFGVVGRRVLHDPGVHPGPRPRAPDGRRRDERAAAACPRRSPTTSRTRRCRRSPTRTTRRDARRRAAGHRPPRHRGRQRHRVARGRGEAVGLRHREVERPRQPHAGRRSSRATPTSCRPSRRAGRPVDARSDLFSLGLVLFYCLIGRAAVRRATTISRSSTTPPAASRARTSRASGGSPIRRPRSWNGRWPSDPDERFQTAAEFADALAVHMGGGETGAGQLMRELFGRGDPARNGAPGRGGGGTLPRP